MRTAILAALVVLCSGCAAMGSLPSSYNNMTAEQIKAAVQDKSSSIFCVHGDYAGASITTVAINTDKGIPAGISVSKMCEIVSDVRVRDAVNGNLFPSSIAVPLTVPPMTLTPSKPQ